MITLNRFFPPLSPKVRPFLQTVQVFTRGIMLLALLTAWEMPALSSPAPQERSEKPYALIYGTVWGPENQPVPGVVVKIRRGNDKDKHARWELTSDREGEFAQRVPAGKMDYIIWADLKGSSIAKHLKLKPGTEVTVHVDNDERQDTGLHLTH